MHSFAQTIGCSPALVRKWRKRWCQTRNLEEAPRPGRPRIFQAIVRAQVSAIACSKPTDFDVSLARWSCSDIGAPARHTRHCSLDSYFNSLAMAKI
ncbi:helix-turn-helix domain-containing protein [Scytonema sp. PCC 10023]|uniref:helix-turn-helix domain-containing protein n=1 Tax=Scytonema sp. PCC 10023 TaxID=1680591 RepID=UPI0039C5CD19